MRRLSGILVPLVTAAMCALSIAATPSAYAARLLDVGPGGAQLSAATGDPTFDPGDDLQTATVGSTHLPAWVQTVLHNVTLYTADSGNAAADTKLGQYTFLRVLSSGSVRLQVRVYDANGNPAQQGWVDPNQVLPSAPGTGWLVAASATPLWSSPDASASNVRQIDRFAPLQKIDGSVQQGRIQVRVYRPDFNSVIGQGWVDASATGPALPPQIGVSAPTTPSSTSTSSQSQAAFLQSAGYAARLGQAQTGVPASVTVAQAILESSWGQSELAVDANNYFGIKAIGGNGDAGVVWLPTDEYDDSGQLYQTISAFRAYSSLIDSMADHDQLLATSSRYAPAMQARSDPKQFASLIAQEGYSTDPAYSDKLVSLMDRYNLYQFDS